MEKQLLTKCELSQQLEKQFSFLIKSCNDFDKGDTNEAIRIALTLRVLLHDARTSHSLLGRLGLKTTFFNSSENTPEIKAQIYYSWAQISLAGRLIGNSTHFYAPHFGLRKDEGMVNFDTWWDMIVVVDKEKNSFSRKGIILAMADQDGGAHVDEQLQEDYYKLTRQNSVKDYYKYIETLRNISPSQQIEMLRQAPSQVPPVSPAYYTVRQIAHEVLVSKLPEITHKNPLNYEQNIVYSGMSTAFMTTYAGTEAENRNYTVSSGKFSIDSLSEDERIHLEQMFGRKLG